jgi:G3E family GTPase
MTVVSGYLGAGKTTLLNRTILSHGRPRLCVIVNDFGELSIDAEVLRRAEGQTLALPNGCVCCTAASGLYKAFEAALGILPRPSHILLEASGVADPARLIAIARAEPEMRAGKVVTVVDAATVATDLRDRLKAPDILRQLQAADVVLLAKTDVVDATTSARVNEIVAELAPSAIVDTVQSALADEYLISCDETDACVPATSNESPHRPQSRYASRSLRCGTLADRNGFLTDLEKLGPGLIRLKGLVAVQGSDAFYLLNVVGGRAHLEAIELAVPPLQSCITTIVAHGSGVDIAVEAIVRQHFTDRPDLSGFSEPGNLGDYPWSKGADDVEANRG